MFESDCTEIYGEFVMDELLLQYRFHSVQHSCLKNMYGGDLLICEFILN